MRAFPHELGENSYGISGLLEFIRACEDVMYRSRVCAKKPKGLGSMSRRPSQRQRREKVYIEYSRIPESLAICRHPLIPRNCLAPLKDFPDVSIEPTWRRRSGEFPEGRLEAENPVFDEGGHKDEERCRKKRQKKKVKHLDWN